MGYQIDGHYIPAGEMYDMPGRVLEKATPVYEAMPGWQADTTRAQSFEELPEEAQAYILKIEELVHMPVTFVSVGPHREQTIQRADNAPDVW